MRKNSPQIGKNVKLGLNVEIAPRVTIGDGTRIESGTILHTGVRLGRNCHIGRNVILGERLRSYYLNPKKYGIHPCVIGNHALLRAGTIIYGDVKIGNHFETGPYVSIREKTVIGHHSRIGNFSDIQGFCKIGNHVSAHSNVTVGQFSVIQDYAWLHPYAILLNDRFPPAALDMKGPTLGPYSVLGAGSIIFPAVRLGRHVIVAAGARVKQDVKNWQLVNAEGGKPSIDCRKLMAVIRGKMLAPYPWTAHRQPDQR